MYKGYQKGLRRRIELRDDFMIIAVLRDQQTDDDVIQGLTKLMGLISSLSKEEELKYADN